MILILMELGILKKWMAIFNKKYIDGMMVKRNQVNWRDLLMMVYHCAIYKLKNIVKVWYGTKKCYKLIQIIISFFKDVQTYIIIKNHIMRLLNFIRKLLRSNLNSWEHIWVWCGSLNLGWKIKKNQNNGLIWSWNSNIIINLQCTLKADIRMMLKKD